MQEAVTFERFYADRYAWAVRLARDLTGDAAVAEELAQEAFIAVRRRFADVDHPASYLRAVIVNAARSYGRRRLLERRHAPSAPDPSTPEHLVELADVLNGLPLRQRSAIVLRYLEGLDDDEIAGLLGCRRSTVRSLVHRGLHDLREVLGT